MVERAHVLGSLLKNDILGLGAPLDRHADLGVLYLVA